MKNNSIRVIQNLKRWVREPSYGFRLTKGLVRGGFYVIYYRLFRRNVRIRFPFFAYAKVAIIGPGSVSIGRNCHVFENVFRGLTIVTLSRDAVVTIGAGCSLGGLTVRCINSVEIGDKTMSAVSLVQDSFFVNMDEAESTVNRGNAIPPARPLVIGNNVWLGGHSLVLGGSRVGDDCVLAACSVSNGIELKEYSLASGNPVKRALPIQQLLALRK